MKTLKLKKILAVAVAAFGLAAVAEPKVEINKIENTNIWSMKVVTYTVSDVSSVQGEYSYNLAFDVTAYSVTTNIKMGTAQNGTFTKMFDMTAIFGEKRKDPNAKIRVSVEREWDLTPVQLWENGPYFAKCNVGASAPQEYGYYFWWGDTVGYVYRPSSEDGNIWSSVKDGTTFQFVSFGSNPSRSVYNKSIKQLFNDGYIDADSNDGKLTPAHDAATQHLGEPWRMMTKEELETLAQCESEWKENWNGTGVNGRLVRGMGTCASNSVFFPATGIGNGSARTDKNGGLYWCSAPAADSSTSSRSLSVVSSATGPYVKVDYVRYFGLSVRPVRSSAE